MFPFCAVGFASSPALAALRMHLGVYPHGGRGPAVRVLLMEKNASEVWLFGEELFDLGVAQVGMNPEAVVDVGAIEILRRFEGNGRYGHRDLLLNFFTVQDADRGVQRSDADPCRVAEGHALQTVVGLFQPHAKKTITGLAGYRNKGTTTGNRALRPSAIRGAS